MFKGRGAEAVRTLQRLAPNRVNVEARLTYFLDRVHEYDKDYCLDIADFLPSRLVSKGLLKKSENLRQSSENIPTIFRKSPKTLGKTSKSTRYLHVVHRMLTMMRV